MLRVIPKIEKHEPHKNAAVISGVMEGLELPAPLVLLLLTRNERHLIWKSCMYTKDDIS